MERVGKVGKFLLFPQDGKVRVTSPFGMRSGKMHRGVDLASDNIGTDWNLVAADSTVTRVSYEAGGAGHWLEAKVDFPVNGKVAYIRYYHLREPARLYDRANKPPVRVGDKLKQGEKLGIEGNTGASYGSHLHFELRLGGNASINAVDPVPFLLIPKSLPIDGGADTRAAFKVVRYVEDFKEDDDMVLRLGDKGREVVAVQSGLLSLGYSLGGFGATGNYLELTVEAVKKFQADNGLSVDGQAGPETISKLIVKLSEVLNAPNVKLTTAKSLGKQIAEL